MTEITSKEDKRPGLNYSQFTTEYHTHILNVGWESYLTQLI